MTTSSAKQLADLLWTSKNAEEFQAAIEDLFTPAEIKTILERWQTLSLLLEDHTHREVQKRIRVSISKVTHAANLLKNEGGQGVRRLYLHQPK